MAGLGECDGVRRRERVSSSWACLWPARPHQGRSLQAGTGDADERGIADIPPKAGAFSVSIDLPHDDHCSHAGSGRAAVGRVSVFFAAVLGERACGLYRHAFDDPPLVSPASSLAVVVRAGAQPACRYFCQRLTAETKHTIAEPRARYGDLICA